MKRTAKISNDSQGRKIIRFSTEVEIEEYVDVDVRVLLDDVIDDIIDNMDDDVLNEVLKKKGRSTIVPFEMPGLEFKRHLCDLLGLGYHANRDQILNTLNERI